MYSPKVSIIIPVYNREKTVARTIKSALDQSYKNIEVIVIDDGSTDKSAEVAQNALGDRGVYAYQENQGVAIARNTGFFQYATGDLIVCVDADDAIGPRYLEFLVPEIWPYREIGIVYTALRNINPDGSESVSPWPSEFNARKHFYERFNQVHTAALARREVWERLNGQRQRYAPYGAGAEDGDFWLRAGAYGFGIKYVFPKYGKDCQFWYTTGQGLVSGNRSYKEVDYRSWSPWTSNPSLMPVASIAPAASFSHAARRYDEPLISVIIPVGPGHSKYLVDSLDSLDAQTFKKWEAIVVFDIGKDEWDSLYKSGELDRISTGWPACRFTSTHANGKFARELTDTLDVVTGDASLLAGLPAGQPRGAGAARNVGIHMARAPLLIFLDADDYFMPTALEDMFVRYQQEKKIIFSEHYGIAPIEPEKKDLVLGDIVFYNEKKQLAVIEQGVKDYNCQEAAVQPYTDGRPPYIICNVSSLIPKKWALELGGFTEKLSSWEDVLFWWMASWRGYCFAKVDKPLLVYRYHTGLRRELGRENAHALLKYIKGVREGMTDMGCKCGEVPGAGTVIDSHGDRVSNGGNMATLRLSRGGQLQIADDTELVLVKFEPPDRGDKLRYGYHDFGGGNFINYGRLSGGEQIFVHKLDLEADTRLANAQGRLPVFRLTEQPIREVPELGELEPPEEISEPASIRPGSDVDIEGIFDPSLFLEPEPLPEDDENYFPERDESATPKRITPVGDLDVGNLRNPARYISVLEEAGLYTAFDIVKYVDRHENGLQELDGIGPKASEAFENAARALV